MIITKKRVRRVINDRCKELSEIGIDILIASDLTDEEKSNANDEINKRIRMLNEIMKQLKC